MPALQSPHVLLEGWGTKAVAHSQVILSVAVASQLHNHPSPTLWLFALRVQTLGPSLFRRPPAWPPGGLSTHAPGCFPVITGFTCLPAHQNSGKSARTTPRFSNPEGRAHPASVTNAQQMGVGGGRGSVAARASSNARSRLDFALSCPSVGQAQEEEQWAPWTSGSNLRLWSPGSQGRNL